jgi:hypothetical protein
MAEAIKPVKIKGTAFWACLDKVNTISGNYQLDIGELSEAAVKALEEMGITALHKEQQGFYITCKSQYTIFAVDPDGYRITDKVGNGSKVIALIVPYDWKFKNKKGVSASLKKRVITELVRYEAGDDADVADDEEAL